MYTLNETIKLLTDVADGHDQIAMSGVGDLAEWNPSERNYPLLWIVPVDTETENGQLGRTFRIGCFDRVIKGEEGQDDQHHEQEVLSDMEMVLLDFVAYFVQQDQEGFFTTRIANLVPATEQMDDRLAGYFVELTILHDWDFNKCQIPATIGSPASDVDGLTLYDFCDASVLARLTDAQNTCLTTAFGACDDATVKSSASSPLYTETVASGATLTLPKGKVRQSDGVTDILVEYQPNTSGYIFQADVCAAVPTTTVEVYSDVGLTTSITSAAWGDTVYIKVVGANITPTAYRFVTDPSSGIAGFTEQVGQSLAFTIETTGTVDIYGIATDGTGAPSNPVKFELTVNADADAVAFIEAHNTATGSFMAVVQQTAIFNFVAALKGTGTPNGSDLWTCFDTSTSEIYPYCPVSDSLATADGYQIDLIDPTVDAVLNNFTAGDITTLGVTSGTGKYLAMKRAPNTFGQDDLAVHVYPRTSSISAISMEIGSINAASWTGIGVSLWPHWSTGIAMHCNSTYSLTGTYSDGQGLLTVQRDNASTMEYYQDSVQIATTAFASSAPISQTFYGHATQLTTGVAYEGTNQLALLAATCSMTANERADWFFAVDQYQTQVITGGRNV